MWFLCLRRNVRPRDERRTTLGEHLSWMREQHESGRILMSGPGEDRSLGIYLIRAPSRPEADAVAAADPFTVSGDCNYELIHWDVQQIAGIGGFSPPAVPSS